MKALGLGISLPPNSFDVVPFIQNMPVQVKKNWLYAASGEVEGYCYSVCAFHPIDLIKWVEWNGG